MKDYERYMSRQRLSETGMARLMKLETERPKKGERVVRERTGRSRWTKYAGLAACLCLIAGLCALPVLRQVGQLFQPAEEELVFHEVDSVPFTDQAIAGGIPLTAMEPADAAEIFGCAPDDFVGLLETVGLSKFDMEYYAVDMAHYPLGVAPQGDDGYRFLMKGSYISPREKPENWDEISETDWEMWKGVSNFFPGNDVWLEIYEGHSYQDEADWKALEPQTFHGCQVTAAYDENNYHAAAAFDLESGGKTYGVLYSAVTYGEANAKELVTKLVSYLTTNGLFVEDRGTPQVKTTGLYVMERGESDYPVMPRIFFDGESYTFGQSLLSSHLCRGGYEVANGRVTARCDEHHFVFDIVDENTLRFVAAESSKPTNYKGEPQITDGTVFRWQAAVDGDEVQPLDYAELTQPYAYVDFYKALEKNDFRELTKDELAKVFPASAGEAGVNYVWTGTAWFRDDGNLRAVVITGEKMDEAGTVILTLSTEEELAFTRNQMQENGKTTYFGTDNTAYGSGIDLVRCFYVNEPGHFNNAPGAYWCYTQCKPASNPLYDYTGYTLYAEVRTSVSEGSLRENEVFNTQWFETMYQNGLWFQTGNVNGEDIWKLPEAEEHSVQEYATLDDLRASVDEKFLPYLPTTLMDHDEFWGIWRRNNAEYESVDVRWDKPWIIEGSYARFSYSGDVDVMWPIAAMGLPEVTDIADRESYDFREHPGLTFPDSMSSEYTEFYRKLESPTFRAQDASLDLIESRIYHWDPEDEIDGYPEAKTVCRFQLLHDNNVLVRYQFHGMTAEEIWKVVRETIPESVSVEPTGVFYMESADGETLVYPYLNLSGNGNTFSWWRGEESSRSGSYAVANGKVRCHRSGKTYVFETVDENTLRFVGAESDALDYLDAD